MSDGFTSNVSDASGAPAATSSNTGVAVLVGGAVTTALSLVGVYVAGNHDVNLMGFYADYIVPIGAFLVGAVASSGYGITSWITGTKISGRLLIGVLVFLLGAYGLAQYLEFRVLFPGGAVRDDGTTVDFLTYFEAVTRNIRFEEHGKVGAPIGFWGYGVRALEIVGFVGGGLVTPLVLRNKPYCESCQRYKRSPTLAWIPAGVVPKKISKKKTEELAAQAAALQTATERASAGFQAIMDSARKGDAAMVTQAISEHGQLARGRAVNKLSHRMQVQMIYCPRCHIGTLRTAMLTGHGKYIRRQPVADQDIEAGLVGQLLQSR